MARITAIVKRTGVLTDFELDKNKLIKDLKKDNADLEERCVELEQYSRKNCVKIEGIEEREHEDTFNTVMDLSRSVELDPPLRDGDIDNCHRVGAGNQDGKPRAIIVKFRNYPTRRRFFESRKRLKHHNVFINNDRPGTAIEPPHDRRLC